MIPAVTDRHCGLHTDRYIRMTKTQQVLWHWGTKTAVTVVDKFFVKSSLTCNKALNKFLPLL